MQLRAEVRILSQGRTGSPLLFLSLLVSLSLLPFPRHSGMEVRAIPSKGNISLRLDFYSRNTSPPPSPSPRRGLLIIPGQFPLMNTDDAPFPTYRGCNRERTRTSAGSARASWKVSIKGKKWNIFPKRESLREFFMPAIFIRMLTY